MLDTIIRRRFDTIGSTHTYASAQDSSIEKGVMLVVSAEEQTAGRGRYGRSWSSPKGEALTVSFGFLFDSQRTDAGNIPQVLALSAVDVLEEYGVTPLLKWPNDLSIDRKKIGGILATAHRTNSNDNLYMVVSIGLNVSVSAEFLEKLGRPATSLFIETGKIEDRDTLLEAILNKFVSDFNRFIIKGFSFFLEKYKSKMQVAKGEKISFHHNNTLLEGVFFGIEDSGTLLLELPDGIIKEFASGELIMME